LISRISVVEDISGLKVTIMGLGLNGGGLASARFFAEAGAAVTVTDMKDQATLAEPVSALEDLPIRFVLGRHEMTDFASADLVIKNPAVRPDSPYILASPCVETDISVFLRLCPSPVIAVTGSKGKSTTASAIHHGLASSGIRAFLGGNIAVSPLGFLDRLDESTPVVLELSSWQLADMKGFGVLRPKIALLTSIMPDHLNRYRSMDEYVADKRLVYADQDDDAYTLCNRDDPWGRSFAAQTPARVRWYADANEGLPGAWLGRERPAAIGYFSDGGGVEQILPESLLVPGPCQRKNLLASALALRLLGLDQAAIRSAMGSFPGVEHRLEFFAEKDGIKWYNDSAATIPQAVAAALESFPGPVVLITGGTDKSLDFGPALPRYLKASRIVLLAGTGTDKLRPLLDAAGAPYHGPFGDLALAVNEAASLARPGDTVLLSPGCTSFGMFLHEFDRGRKFKELASRVLGVH
jgi:UDP-N-acetylmuramoylalanine--D-glutamate ligase